MKKIILAVAVMGLAAMGASTANAGVRFSIGISAPVVTFRAPVYVAPAPVVCAPPVVAYAPPVVCAPRVFCPPAPVVRFGFGHYRPAYHHGCW